ncbi:MAG: bifunctional DNA primase/polymerase [Acidobacteriia bacterium]|nr:bifunctional DNA primase/polymerase [Terriglobia bacterium]
MSTAADLLEMGRSVIPCGRNKKPIHKWKPFQERLPTAQELSGWQTLAPAAWAMVTGAVSGVITLDFDGKHGEKTMRALGLKPHRRTPSGSYHVDFEHPGWRVGTVNGKSKIELGKRYPGLDVRGDGGYACISGRCNGGKYRWLRGPQPDKLDILPPGLRKFLGLLDPPAPAPVNGSVAANGHGGAVQVGDDDPAPTGWRAQARAKVARIRATGAEHFVVKALDLAASDGRNNAGFWLACQLRDSGCAEQEAETIMRNYASRTSGTNTKGQPQPYTEQEAMASVKQAYTREPRKAPRVVPITTAEDLTRYPYTDLGNAERLVALHGGDIRWCEAWQSWLVWNDTRWERDECRRMIALAKHTVRATYAQASDVGDDAIRKALIDHARRAESRQRIDAMIALARPDVAVTPDQLDCDAWLLNVKNGTIDLRTGELRENSREDLLTKLAEVECDPEARCPRWKKFLSEVFEPHPDLIPFLQRAIGYTITADVREECFFLLAGSGRNGKGTFLKTVQALTGDYAGTADFSTFTARRDAGMRDDVANMRGRRLVTAQESHEGAAMAEGLIKWLTGGDRIRARRLYENSSEFDPTFKLWLATNHKPKVSGTDPAIWSRIKLVPFDVSFEGHENKSLKQALLEELPGILAWAVRGCLRWQKDGLKFPASVVEATTEYRSESDEVGRFLSECCILSKDSKARMKSSRLYELYKVWCEQNGEEPLTATAFGRRLTERGMSKQNTMKGVMCEGLSLRE